MELRVYAMLVTVSYLRYCNCWATMNPDGGYTKVVVAISPTIPPDENSTLIVNNLVTVLKRSSEFLFKATQNHAFLKEVDVFLPSSWVAIISEFKNQNVQESKFHFSFEHADIRVDHPNAVHGNQPYTNQPEGCGRYGQYVHYTPSYLCNISSDDNFGDYKKVFVHNWSHLRYGVFDEFGYRGDSIYNKFYYDDKGDVQPTACIDVPMNGSFINSQKGSKCQSKNVKSLPDQDCDFVHSRSDMKSSLMYSTDESDVEDFCDSHVHQHIVSAPTKQNFICGYRSTWDVIEKSEDISFIRNPAKVDTKINIYVNKEKNVRYSFVIDNSANMKKNNEYQILRMSLLNLQDKLTDGKFNISFITYSDVTRFAYDYTPVLADISSLYKSCIKCGINAAVDNKPDVIILITNGLINQFDFKIISNKLKNENIIIYVILYPTAQYSSYNVWINLTKKYRGSVFIINDENMITEKIGQIQQALLTIFNQNNIDLKRFPDGIAVKPEGNTTYENVISFEPQAAKVTENLLMLTCTGDQQLEFKSPGYAFNPNSGGITTYYSFYKVYVINKHLNGKCAFKLKLKKNASCNLIIKRANGSPLKIKSWISSRRGVVNLVNGALAIYAEISTEQYQPIGNAVVTASIFHQKENENGGSSSDLQLIDNGSGDPDLTKNDGVYSGYLTHPLSNGLYQIIIKIDGTNKTFVNLYTQSNDSEGHCCGSTIPINHKSLLEPFQHKILLGLVHLQNLDAKVDKHPSRIGDLKCTPDGSFSNSDQELKYKVNLTWTAPGSYLTSGNATSYKIRVSNRSRDLLAQNFRGTVIKSSFKGRTIIPRPAYENEIITIALDTHGLHFFAVFAINEYGNPGKLSNIAQTYIKEASSSDGQKTLFSSGYIIALVCFGLLLFLTCGLIIFFIAKRSVAKKQRKKEELEQQNVPPIVTISLSETLPVYSVEDTLKNLKMENGYVGSSDKLNDDMDPRINDNAYDNPNLDSSNPDENSINDGAGNPSTRKSFRRITLV